MSTHISAATWERVIAQAWDGDPRHLLELLLRPFAHDSHGQPLPGAFYALPDDPALRLKIVSVLMRGPWNPNPPPMDDLVLRVGWGKTRPKLSDHEVAMADLFLQLFGKQQDDQRSAAELRGLTADLRSGLADALSVTDDQLRKRIAALRKRKSVKALGG